MDALTAIRTRRSVRHYEDRPVPEGLVRQMLAAAMSAPSAGNAQPWHFIVITDREILQRIAEIHPYAKMAAQAAVGFLVCGDSTLELFPGYWVQDCSAATQNLLLAAHALGLGAVWTGIFPREDRVDAFRALFQLPDPVMPLAFVPVGHPAESPTPQDRFREERVHQNAWQRRST